jgi:hypothetical protein
MKGFLSAGRTRFRLGNTRLARSRDLTKIKRSDEPDADGHTNGRPADRGCREAPADGEGLTMRLAADIGVLHRRAGSAATRQEDWGKLTRSM